MTWSNILKPPFWGSGENLHFWGSASLVTDRMLPIVHISKEIQEINMSSNTCYF